MMTEVACYKQPSLLNAVLTQARENCKLTALGSPAFNSGIPHQGTKRKSMENLSLILGQALEMVEIIDGSNEGISSDAATLEELPSKQ